MWSNKINHNWHSPYSVNPLLKALPTSPPRLSHMSTFCEYKSETEGICSATYQQTSPCTHIHTHTHNGIGHTYAIHCMAWVHLITCREFKGQSKKAKIFESRNNNKTPIIIKHHLFKGMTQQNKKQKQTKKFKDSLWMKHLQSLYGLIQLFISWAGKKKPRVHPWQRNKSTKRIYSDISQFTSYAWHCSDD